MHRIKYSVPQRDSRFSIDPEKVYDWYAALKIFVDRLYEEAIYFKMEPGTHFAIKQFFRKPNTQAIHIFIQLQVIF